MEAIIWQSGFPLAQLVVITSYYEEEQYSYQTSFGQMYIRMP